MFGPRKKHTRIFPNFITINGRILAKYAEYECETQSNQIRLVHWCTKIVINVAFELQVTILHGYSPEMINSNAS